MKNITIIFSALVLIHVCACNSGKKSDLTGFKQIYVDPDKTERINVADYFKYSSFIVLETTNDNLIAKIDKVQIFDSKIYVMDIQQNSVYIFDENGKYLRKIYRRGGGPEEYIYLTDFNIDSKNGNIQVYDGLSGRILNYTNEGQFLNKKEVSKGYSFISLKNNRWMFYSHYGSDKGFYNLNICDENFAVTDVYLPFPKYLDGRTYTLGITNSIFSEYNNILHILPLLSNRIYAYNRTANGIEGKYEIVFAGQKRSYFDENSSENEVKKALSSFGNETASHIHGFYSLNSLVLFKFSYRRTIHSCLYDELTDKTICDEKVLTDEHGLFFYPAVYFSDKGQNQILSIMDIEYLNRSKQKNPTNAVIQEISEAVKVEDSNPILVFYEVKR
ncbi:MAG: 6-bladed beta-propeller [Prevotellaceae bacterium]|jgi:hypothetical protein|nr:6-bladed beta-propeller [Prevotellaceae bacterium]